MHIFSDEAGNNVEDISYNQHSQDNACRIEQVFSDSSSFLQDTSDQNPGGWVTSRAAVGSRRLVVSTAVGSPRGIGSAVNGQAQTRNEPVTPDVRR